MFEEKLGQKFEFILPLPKPVLRLYLEILKLSAEYSNKYIERLLVIALLPGDLYS